jgi:predicted GNAT family acetyltransferase
MSENITPVWNEGRQRFEVALDGKLAVAEYRIEGGRMLFTHTEVPVENRGRGIAEKLVLVGFQHAREKGLQIVPICSYVGAILKRHPEYQAPE